MRIDAHQHFWAYNADNYPWITPEIASLKRDFLPTDLEPLLHKNKFDGCIAVQVRQSLEETHWLLQLAEQHSMIKGVVGWVDLKSAYIAQQLESLSTHPALVGVRHVVQDEPDVDFMLNEAFTHGISHLEKHGLRYDILIYPKQLPAAIALAKMFPNQLFVIDHIAKPNVASGETEFWEKHIKEFKALENMYCKVSGMVTEAKWDAWTPSDFMPYLDTIMETFGTDRVMFGSDWPVCLLAADYQQVLEVVNNYFNTLSQVEQEKLFGINCLRFYLNQ